MSEMVLIFVALRLVSRRTWNHRWTRTHAPSARARRSDGYAQEGARALCGRVHGQRTMMRTPVAHAETHIAITPFGATFNQAQAQRRCQLDETNKSLVSLWHYGAMGPTT